MSLYKNLIAGGQKWLSAGKSVDEVMSQFEMFLTDAATGAFDNALADKVRKALLGETARRDFAELLKQNLAAITVPAAQVFVGAKTETYIAERVAIFAAEKALSERKSALKELHFAPDVQLGMSNIGAIVAPFLDEKVAKRYVVVPTADGWQAVAKLQAKKKVAKTPGSGTRQIWVVTDPSGNSQELTGAEARALLASSGVKMQNGESLSPNAIKDSGAFSRDVLGMAIAEGERVRVGFAHEFATGYRLDVKKREPKK